MTLRFLQETDRCSRQSCTVGLHEASGNSDKVQKFSPQNWKYQQISTEKNKIFIAALPAPTLCQS